MKIERVLSLPHEIARMDRSQKVAAHIEQLLEGAGLKDWSFLLCAWLPGEQPVIVTGIRKGCDVVESVKDGALWLLKGAEAKQAGDPMPIVTGRP